MKKAILIGALALVAVVVIVVWRVIVSLDAIVASAIERHGSELTGTRVKVSSVSIDLRKGRGTIAELTVANPSGYEAANAFALGEITLDVDTASLASEPLVIDEIIVAAPEVVYELDSKLRSNVQALMENVERSAGGGAGKPAAADSAGEADGELRLRVKRFSFRAGRVEARTSAAGGKDVTVEMPALTMNDLGGADGASPEQIGTQILKAYTAQVARLVASKQVRGALDSAIDEKLSGETGEAVKGLLDRVLK